MRPMRCPAIVLVALMFSVPARAEKVTLDKPVPVTQKKLDKRKVSGRIIAYDEEGLELRVEADERQGGRWSEWETKTPYAARKIPRKPRDAAGHGELGREMQGLEGGKQWSEKAFAVARTLDPALKDSVAEIKKEAAENPPEKD